MPNTKNFQLLFNNQQADVDLENLDITINDILEEPENFLSKQGSDALNITLPCTKQNDAIFNTFHNQNVQDLSPSGSGSILTSAIGSGGGGYLVGQFFYIPIAGGVPAYGQITGVGGGGDVTSYIIITPGEGYTAPATILVNVVSSGGSGFTIDILSVALGGSGVFRSWMDFKMYSNGVIIFVGKAVLVSCTITDKPEYYTIEAMGGSASWIIDMQNLTLWDCVSTTPHDFTVANVQNSWNDFDSDEDHDYVYAPVRYRQPFGPNDDAVNIYALRPSISIYWLIIRAFRQFGYTIDSQFFNTSNYFRRFVLNWTFGSFYDINSQITDGLSFKAAGATPKWIDFSTGSAYNFPGAGAESQVTYVLWKMWMGLEPGSVAACMAVNPQPDSSLFYIESPLPLGPSYSTYIKSYTGAFIPYTSSGCFTLGNTYSNFRINNTLVPNGYDNLGLYSFDETTGTMQWTYQPPAAIAPFFGTNITANFALNLYAYMNSISGKHCYLHLEVKHYNSGSVLLGTTVTPIIFASGGGMSPGSPGVSGGGGVGGTLGRPMSIPWVYNFSQSGVNQGDYLTFRFIFETDSGLSGTGDQTISIASSFYLDTNPTTTGANTWQYNPVTQRWGNVDDNVANPIWQLYQSSLTMTNLQIQLGNSVNFQYYDVFRNYEFMNLLGGLIELFNLEVKTDPINRVVSIEPMFGTEFPDGTVIDGFFSTSKIIDWSNKRDRSKASKMELFSNSERQLDFSMKQDGSDGGQNIYAARYKGIYLNNVIKPKLNNTSIENGIIAGVPGASRYMLPDRFAKGNKQLNNRFFSSTMHYKHTAWANLGGFGGPAPQLICIFPENINDSSASAVTQTFEPKIAFYAGQQATLGVGAWRWVGDPDAPYTDGGSPSAIGFQLPYMFAVDYTGYVGTVPGQIAPVLSYCDQNVNGVIEQGLMRRYFLRRLAIMRWGNLCNAAMRLNLSDISNWGHRECLKVDNAIYALVSIQDYKPLDDTICKATMWQVVNPEQVDLNNSYPSTASILSYPTILGQYDLKYGQLLLFPSDIPQV